MRTPGRRSLATVLLLPLLVAGASPALAQDGSRHGRAGGAVPATFTLSGDRGGSQFEGIAVARDHRTFYATEVSGGEVHRGRVDDPDTEVWLDEFDARAADRTAAAGIAIDRRGRVYVAGGGNRSAAGAGPEAPDFWVYDDNRDLLAALRMPVDGDVFLNDVVIGPDGAAYVTDSRSPRVFRIAREDGHWQATLWASTDRDGGPAQGQGFGLNGIEVSLDGQFLVAVNSSLGELWRYDLDTAEASQVDIGDADLVDADGLVVRGCTLVAVRNQPHLLAYLRLAWDASAAEFRTQVATPADRVLTTADVARGKLLLVDSQFDEAPPSQDSEVVVLPFRPAP
jgi:sugar lactone lactonase YvrE